MIIPIRCFSCGKVIADKWTKYKQMCDAEEKKEKNGDNSGDNSGDTGEKLHPSFQGNKGKILNELGITKICCRRHFLGHVDLIEII